MARHHERPRAKHDRSRRGPKRPIADDPFVTLVPTDPEAMVMAGNKPHLVLLHDFTLEDIGLGDVLRLTTCRHL